MIALRGVRNSWLTVARKRYFASFACSACLRAASSASSAALRPEMSFVTATVCGFDDLHASSVSESSGWQRVSTQMNDGSADDR